MIPIEVIMDWLFVIASASAAAAVSRLFVEPLLPSHIREFVGYHYKRVRKRLARSSIDVTLVVTANSQVTEPVPVAVFMKHAKQTVAKCGYKPHIYDESMTFDTPLGQYARSRPHSQSRTLETRLAVCSDEVDGELVAEGVKLNIHHTCTLSGIAECLLELRSTLSLIEPIMDDLGLELVREMCLECKLSRMSNVGIMLKAMQEESIRVRAADGRGFELTEDRIRYYTEMMDADLHKFLKQIIVAYA